MPCHSGNPYTDITVQAIQEKGSVRTTFRGRSMKPTLVDGMLLRVEKTAPRAVKTADIILYRRDEQVVVHRVIRVLPKDASLVFMTMGDNQGYAGADYVGESDLIGIVRGAFSKERPEENILADGKLVKLSYWMMGILVSFILAAKRYSPRPVRRIFGPFVDAMFGKRGR